MSIVTVHGPNMVGEIAFPATANTTNLAGLQGDAVYGNSGTSKPTTAWPADWKTRLKDGSYANWNGTAWVVATIPTFK